MSENPGRKRKERDSAADPNASDHELSNPQSQAAGRTVKKKKRKIMNLDFMYLGDSDTENKQGSESQKEADDITADDVVSANDPYQEHTEKLKKSHKTKDSKRLHGDEAPDVEPSDLDGRPKKKKKKLKKDHEERLLEDLAEESLTADIQQVVRKKIRRQDGGGLQGGDDGSHRHDFLEEPYSQGNNPDGSETAKQMNVKKKKKKKKRNDEPNLEDDITADETSSIVLREDHKEKLKKSHKSKYLKTLSGGEDLPKPSVKKKLKKDCREHLLEEEESSTPDASEKKTKRKDGGDEHHRLRGFNEGPVTTEQGSKSIDQDKDCLVEEFLISETQHVSKKKKKRKDGGDKHRRLQSFSEELVTKRKYQEVSETTEQVIESVDQAEDLAEESSISETQHVSKKKKKKRKDGFTERLVSQLEGPEGSENPEQVDENMEQIEKPVKKKKKRKDEPRQEGDGLAVDNASSSVGLCEDEASYRELTEAEDKTSRKKKKSKKDQWERPLVDVEESEECEKNKIKRKDGGSEGSRQKKHQGGAETTDQVDEHMGLTEKPVKKKKKRKDKPHQEADGLAVDNESSSLGLHGAEPPYSEGTETGDGSRRKKKKKSKKDHLEDTEESWTSDSQHKSKKKTKRKDGGGENNRQDGFIVSKRQHDVGSESPRQMVDLAEERKKKKKHSDRMEETSEVLTEEMQLEGGEAPEDSPEVNQPYQGHVVEGGGNVEGGAEENTGQTSSSRRDRPQTPAPPDADQNPDKTIQNEGDGRSTASDENAENVKKKKRIYARFIREKDVALIREFFPKITEASLWSFSPHEVERIRVAKQNGIMFRTGQFTNEEDEQIKENVQRFMTEVGINSAVMLFHPFKYPEIKKTITELKRKFHFQHRIAVGLRRPTGEVYERGIKIYDPSTVRGRYTEEEVQRLKKYCEMYDNWSTIGSLMNRSYKTTQLKASQLRRDVNVGKWSVAEMNRLIAAVKEFVLNAFRKLNNTNEEPVTVPKEMLYKGISWVSIEEKVGTRNWTHCKIKWFTIIMLRMNDYIHPFHGSLGILNSIKIIQWFHDSGAKDYCDVKWDNLCDFLGNIPNTIVQNRFVNLKRLIPDWRNLRLYEIVDNLYSDILPKLEGALAMAKEVPIAPTKKTEFLISDMFQEYSEAYEFK